MEDLCSELKFLQEKRKGTVVPGGMAGIEAIQQDRGNLLIIVRSVLDKRSKAALFSCTRSVRTQGISFLQVPPCWLCASAVSAAASQLGLEFSLPSCQGSKVYS